MKIQLKKCIINEYVTNNEDIITCAENWEMKKEFKKW